MADDAQQFYFGYLRRLDDGRVLGRVAFDTTRHALLPEVELGRIATDADVLSLRAALVAGFDRWIRRCDWSRLPAPRPAETMPSNVTRCVIAAQLPARR